jgi:hypothetical protein
LGEGKGEGNKGAKVVALTSVLSQRERKQNSGSFIVAA